MTDRPRVSAFRVEVAVPDEQARVEPVQQLGGGVVAELDCRTHGHDG